MGAISCAIDTSVVDPFGTNTATKITETTATAQHRLYSTATTTLSKNKYSISALVKAGTDYVVGLGTGTNTGLGWAVYDLSSGVVSNSGTSGTPFITPLANGWFRVGIRGATSSLTGAPTAAGILYSVNNNPAAGNQPSFTGDGSYFHATDVCFEQGLVETSPILDVVTTTVTRAADQLGLTIPSGAVLLRLTFDDNSTQDIDVTAYAGSTTTIDPTTLIRPCLMCATVT